MKFKIYDDEDAKYVKNILDEKKISFKYAKKVNKRTKNKKVDKDEDYKDKIPVRESTIVKRRGRKRLTKEEKEARKKNRTKEQQEAINKRMAAIRAKRNYKKKDKDTILDLKESNSVIKEAKELFSKEDCDKIMSEW